MSIFGLTLNLKSPDRNNQFILNIPSICHVLIIMATFSFPVLDINMKQVSQI